VKITFKPQTEWLPPQDFPDLSKYDEIAIDLETKDPNLNERMGNGFKINSIHQLQKYFTTQCMMCVG
jgi:hypothetical protein